MARVGSDIAPYAQKTERPDRRPWTLAEIDERHDIAERMMIRRRSISTLVSAGCSLPSVVLAVPTVAQSKWDLITPEEDARDRAAPKAPGPSDLPAPPVIELVHPADISKPVQNPIAIELRFASGSGPAIDMQSFRATYGWLGIDITKPVAGTTLPKLPDSLVAENVDICRWAIITRDGFDRQHGGQDSLEDIPIYNRLNRLRMD